MNEILDFLLSPPAVVVLKIGIAANVIMVVIAAMTWLERRLSAWIQFRLGPNRVGPFGLLQPIADGIKFFFKEDILPRDAHKFIFVLAPMLAFMTALCAFAVIPYGPTIEILGHQIALVGIDLDGGLLFAYAFTALGVYGLVCAGWASRSKYSLMGGLRSSAQMISYELALGLSVIGVLLVAGTLRPVEIVNLQAGWFWNWNVLKGAWQPVGFLIFVIAGYAECNRLPFDLPEAETELVAGYHTEYSSIKFSMFFFAEYINMITSAALAVTLFLGGFHLGFPPELIGLSGGWPLWLAQIGAFVLKVSVLMFTFVWVRWTLPRFRYDQLMNLGWKRLFPLALANVMVTALLVAFDKV